MTKSAQPISALLFSAAFFTAILVAILRFNAAFSDSGSFALIAFGVPLLCAGTAMAISLAKRGLWLRLSLWALTLASLAWGLMMVLGLGLVMLIPGLLMLIGILALPANTSGQATVVPPSTPPRPPLAN